jgi:hypothetical protein
VDAFVASVIKGWNFTATQDILCEEWHVARSITLHKHTHGIKWFDSGMFG